MPPAPTHADLVARALGALSAQECAFVDLALEEDAALRDQFEQIAAHLLRYDHLPPAPPAPAFALLDAAIEASSPLSTGSSATSLGLRTPASAEGSGEPDAHASLSAAHGHAANKRPSPAPDLRVLALQDRRQTPIARRGMRWGALAASAALVIVLLWSPWRDRFGSRQANRGGPHAGDLTLVPGPGLKLLRAGRWLPAPARALRDLRPGDELHCEAPAEAHLAGRVRVVLDAGTSLRIEPPSESTTATPTLSAVRLSSGRAWFEVAPGAFEVRTPHGPVRVLGTAFEVDLRAGRLDIAVAHGRVEVLPHPVRNESTDPPQPLAERVQLTAGWGLRAGRRERLAGPAGAWFRRPHLRLALTNPAPATRGTPLRMELHFSNPGQVPVRLRGPGAVRTALWISFETREGRTVAEMPVLPTDVVAGQALLKPGAGADLHPGQDRVLTIEILPPLGSPGTYRCRALYRPEGQPAVLSDPLDLEVR